MLKWQSFKRFCDEQFPDVKFKNDVQRRAFLVKKGLKFQKDEKGVEGVVTPKHGEDEKEIKVGKRLSADKIKQEDFGDGSEFGREQREAAHLKNASGLAIQSNSQDRSKIVIPIKCYSLQSCLFYSSSSLAWVLINPTKQFLQVFSLSLQKKTHVIT